MRRHLIEPGPEFVQARFYAYPLAVAQAGDFGQQGRRGLMRFFGQGEVGGSPGGQEIRQSSPTVEFPAYEHEQILIGSATDRYEFLSAFGHDDTLRTQITNGE
jgi:hypothetical protein